MGLNHNEGIKGAPLSAYLVAIVFPYQAPGFDCLSLSIDLDYRTIKTDCLSLSIAFDYQHCIIDSQLLLGL